MTFLELAKIAQISHYSVKYRGSTSIQTDSEANHMHRFKRASQKCDNIMTFSDIVNMHVIHNYQDTH